MERKNKKLFFSGVLIVVGGLLLFNNLQMLPVDFPFWIISWPMLLIVIGVYKLVVRKRIASFIFLTGLGTYFLLPDILGIPEEQAEKYWPALIILGGLALLFKKPNPHKGKWKQMLEKKESATDGQLNISMMMSGEKKQVSSYDFKGGNINVVMGGVELDLTNCTRSLDTPVVIELNLIMGGVELLVPRDWNIKSEITPIMGDIDDKASHRTDISIDPQALVTLKGSVIMGGVEIKRM